MYNYCQNLVIIVEIQTLYAHRDAVQTNIQVQKHSASNIFKGANTSNIFTLQATGLDFQRIRKTRSAASSTSIHGAHPWRNRTRPSVSDEFQFWVSQGNWWLARPTRATSRNLEPCSKHCRLKLQCWHQIRDYLNKALNEQTATLTPNDSKTNIKLTGTVRQQLHLQSTVLCPAATGAYIEWRWLICPMLKAGSKAGSICFKKSLQNAFRLIFSGIFRSCLKMFHVDYQ